MAGTGTLVVRAHAKINLNLRVLGRRGDGYHALATVFQAIALHDTVTLAARPGPLAIACDAPNVPGGEKNVVFGAAAALAETAGRPLPPRDVAVRIEKSIPAQAGLGGGSADAAAALVALSVLWDAPRLPLAPVAARVGADVPFFLTGGSAVGRGRGDAIEPLPDLPPHWVVLVLPAFGVSTAAAYGWWDGDGDQAAARARGRIDAPGWPPDLCEVVNDLETPVARRHPEIGRAIEALCAQGAAAAAMSGSGSAVFGLFDARAAADRAAGVLGTAGWRTIVTRTLGREEYARLSRPELADRGSD